jgi:hypothetical protein
MSDKSGLFFAAMQAAKGQRPKVQNFAEGGEVGEAEPETGGDTSVSPEEKLAAYDVLECIKGEGDSQGRAERLAKALKSFFLIVDSQPHEEGGEPAGMEGGSSPFTPQ